MYEKRQARKLKFIDFSQDVKTGAPQFRNKFSIDVVDDNIWFSEIFTAFGHSW